MVDEVKRKPRGPDKGPRKARMLSGTKERPRPTVSYRMRADVYDRTRASAMARGFSLSQEMEARISASFDAETLEATLRRVVREEIAAAMDGDFRPNAVTIAAMESTRRGECERVGSVVDLTASLRADAFDDALAIMAEAQH